MMYYGVLTLCAAMFSVQFFFSQMFQKAYGNDMQAVLVNSAGGAIVGIVVLSLINGFHFSCTPFSLIMAILVAFNGMGFTFCSLKSFGKINLSLYSMFSMLGGMALPFFAGVLFFDEKLSSGKIICFLLISVALCLTIEKDKSTSGIIYYAGIFVLNGLAGVLSKIFQVAPFEKVTAVEYSILCAVVSLALSLGMLVMMRGKRKRLNGKAVMAICGSGVINRVANLLVLICLAYLPASAQYPFITGGTMIFSTIICYLTGQKPDRREVIAVSLSFFGILFMVSGM